MPIFSTARSRILHALATHGPIHANSFVDQRRIDIAAQVLRSPRSYTLQSWPQAHSAYQKVLATQQAIFADALLARLLFCRAAPAHAQQILDSEILTRHIEHQQNHVIECLIIHIDVAADLISVGTHEESAAHAFPTDPMSIRDLAAALLAAQMPLAA